VRSSLAFLAAGALAASPVAAAPRLLWVPVCGGHAPVPLPVGGKGEMPQGCHAACAALPGKKKRLASG